MDDINRILSLSNDDINILPREQLNRYFLILSEQYKRCGNIKNKKNKLLNKIDYHQKYPFLGGRKKTKTKRKTTKKKTKKPKVHTGPRGGKYIMRKGKKVYV